MGVSLIVGTLLALVVVILPQSTSAIKCFQCTSDSACSIEHYFRSDFDNKDGRFVNEGCSFNPSYKPACKYVIDDKSVVRERGCGGVGVTGTETFCKNIRKDVVECYCTTDYCNGVDNLNTAASKAEEHFRRLADATKQETSTVANMPGIAVNNKCSVLGLALVVFLSLMWG